MKIGARDIVLLAVGFVIGSVLAALLTTTAFWLIRNLPGQSTSRADTTTKRCFDTLIAATAADDYNKFVSVADDSFRTAITPDAFHTVSQGLAPRMQGGCTPTYLGQFRENGAQVSLWRLTFADGSDDRLARMSISQDRVGGFLITPAL